MDKDKGDKKLFEYLEKHDIHYKQHFHQAVFTVEESKKVDKGIPGLHTKNLFLKSEKNKFYLVCMPADKRLDMKYLSKLLNAGKLSFASAEQLKEHLNLTPGSVSLFGMVHASSVKLLLDKEVWQADIVGFHPNINTATLELNHENLAKFYNSLSSEKEIIDLG